MDSYSLICFTKLYQLGSIHKAADELYISPQSMSKRLQRLEEELGQMLFERSPSGLAPTPHAHQLAYSANIILNEYERVRAVFNGQTNDSACTLHIASTYGVPKRLSLAFIQDFYRENPSIRLDLVEYPEYPIFDMLDEGKIDFAFLPEPIDIVKYEIEYCFSHRYCLVVNKAHPLAERDSVEYRDLNGIPLAIKGRDYSFYPVNMTRFSRGGLTPQILLEISDDSLIVEVAKQNWCAGITADFFAEQYADDRVAVIPFCDDSFTRNIFLVRRKNQEMSAAEKRFWTFTTDWIQKNMEDSGR